MLQTGSAKINCENASNTSIYYYISIDRSSLITANASGARYIDSTDTGGFKKKALASNLDFLDFSLFFGFYS